MISTPDSEKYCRSACPSCVKPETYIASCRTETGSGSAGPKSGRYRVNGASKSISLRSRQISSAVVVATALVTLATSTIVPGVIGTPGAASPYPAFSSSPSRLPAGNGDAVDHAVADSGFDDFTDSLHGATSPTRRAAAAQ